MEVWRNCQEASVPGAKSGKCSFSPTWSPKWGGKAAQEIGYFWRRGLDTFSVLTNEESPLGGPRQEGLRSREQGEKHCEKNQPSFFRELDTPPGA